MHPRVHIICKGKRPIPASGACKTGGRPGTILFQWKELGRLGRKYSVYPWGGESSGAQSRRRKSRRSG